MAITPLPTPAPSTNDPTNFATRADALVAALPQFITEANQLALTPNIGGSGGSALVGYIASGTGTVATTVASVLNETVSVFRYMTSAQIADVQAGTGLIDVTAAIQLALDSGKSIYLPEGTYRITSGLNHTLGTPIIGSGCGTCQIYVVGSGYDAITLSASYSSISGVFFNADAPRTSGTYVTVASGGRQNIISEFRMNAGYIGIMVNNAVETNIKTGEIINIKASTGIGIYITGGNDTFIDRVVMDNEATVQPMAGVRINKTDAVWMDSVDAIHCGTGLLCDPQGATDYITWLFISNSAFDSGSGDGILLSPSHVSSCIKGSTFVDCWSATNTGSGFVVSGAGITDGLRVIGHRSFNNTRSGYLLASTVSHDLNFSACDASGNSTVTPDVYSGFDIGANVSGFTIQNCRSGGMAGFPNSQSRGILINPGSSNNYSISDNDLRGNTTALYDGGTGTNKIISNNLGDIELNSTIFGQTINSSRGGLGALVISDQTSNGVNIKLTGNGATTPSKTVRVMGGNLEVLNSSYAAIITQIADNGTTKISGGLYAGTPAFATQGSCAIYAGLGAPNNGEGVNGDMYFNGAGGAGTTIYQKRAGAWVGIV